MWCLPCKFQSIKYRILKYFSPMKTSLEGNFLLQECPEGHCSGSNRLDEVIFLKWHIMHMIQCNTKEQH